jgi:UDP-N-acetylmuramoyl-tripeptide--D-alanyl-D-alanine ligase
MEAALKAFSTAGYQNKMVILGDMLELGEYADEEHIKIILGLQQLAFHEVFLVGPVFSRVNTVREFTCFQDSELARLWFEHHKPENSTILLKGSRGIRLEKVATVL